MRKIKTKLECCLPSWNFCNLDGFTANDRFSKETCRFCVKTKTGHRCLLHDVELAADSKFVHKPEVCIKLTAGFPVDITPVVAPPVDPKVIMREAVKTYKAIVTDLVNQGYPQSMAESIAETHLI